MSISGARSLANARGAKRERGEARAAFCFPKLLREINEYRTPRVFYRAKLGASSRAIKTRSVNGAFDSGRK